MSWTLEFKANQKDETIGYLKAVFNAGLSDEFIFIGEANISDSSSSQDFISRAKKSLAEKPNGQVPQKIQILLDSMITDLNK